MAEIQPFKGIRYNLKLIEDPEAVIAQPYDIISTKDQERLHQKNPYNIIRLEYGKTFPANGDSQNRYTRAKETFDHWLQEGILLTDDRPGFYFYEQEFTFQQQKYRRRSLLSALKLEPYSSGNILPHEATMAAPKEDRFKLLQATKANFSPIFALAPDPDCRMAGFFNRAMEEKPLFEAGSGSFLVQRLWSATDPGLIEKIKTYLKMQSLLIADGHHRYETALDYYKRHENEQEPGAGYILAALVSIHDPGLLMLPTHRLLTGLGKRDKETLEEMITANFKISSEIKPANLDRQAFKEEVNRVSLEENGFGYITPQKACLLVPKTGFKNKEEAAPAVSLLHERLLNPLLANNQAEAPPAKEINFLHDFDSALTSVVDGSADAAFILGDFPVARVFEQTGRGRLLPQKSTYFYPKIPGGLVIYHTGKSI